MQWERGVYCLSLTPVPRWLGVKDKSSVVLRTAEASRLEVCCPHVETRTTSAGSAVFTLLTSSSNPN